MIYFGILAAVSAVGVIMSFIANIFGLLVGSVATGILSIFIFLFELSPWHSPPLVAVRGSVVGRWRAALPLEYLPSVKRSLGRTETTLFQGWIEFFEDGSVLWTLDRGYVNLYGDLKKLWSPPYEIFARHVKGHAIHVVIRTGSETDTGVTDIYLQGRQRFPI